MLLEDQNNKGKGFDLRRIYLLACYTLQAVAAHCISGNGTSFVHQNKEESLTRIMMYYLCAYPVCW